MQADQELEISYKKFIKSLQIFTKDIKPDSEILNNDPYPSPHILAQLACQVMTDKGDDSVRDYEKRLYLPDGWRLLTTACNKDPTNGYFGAVFWCPSLQLVVLTHRGSISTFKSVFSSTVATSSKISPHTLSAITFAEILKCAIRETNVLSGRSIQFSVTGFYIGGWLAQATTFSLKYLQMKEGYFVKIDNPKDGLHVHAVAFDSPGCEDMLKKMLVSQNFGCNRSTFLKNLDISIYLGSPNKMNTCGLHAGTMYQVCVDGTSINKFVEALETNSIVASILRWPSSSYTEKRVLKVPSHVSSSRDELKGVKTCNMTQENINSASLSIFSADELSFLDSLSMYMKMGLRPNEIQRFLTVNNLGDIDNLFGKFKIDKRNGTVTCDTKASLERLVKHVKQLVRWFPEQVLKAVKVQMALAPEAAVGFMKRRHSPSIEHEKLPRFSSTTGINLNDYLFDQELKLSCEMFKEVLKTDNSDYFTSNNVNSNVLDMDPYPSPHTLAQLATKVYSYKGDQNDLDYERSLSFPAGWKLLTTAWNNNSTNGYFGAAFWFPTTQLVVLAHREPVLKYGSMFSNIADFLSKISPHMLSAVTFAEIIKCAIHEANNESKRLIQLSVTGHSLGGWLAQVTALTLKSLEIKDRHFIKIHNPRDGLHAHAVTFNSPGCKSMLKQIKISLDLQYTKSIDLNKLDITNYVGPPNVINTCGLHVGMMYRVYIDDSQILQKREPFYAKLTHSVENFMTVFEANRKIHEVLDWPVRKLTGSRLYEPLYKLVVGELEVTEPRYRIENNTCSLRVFSENELDLLYFWNVNKILQLNKFRNIATERSFRDIFNHFEKFIIDKESRIISCETKESLERLIKRIKQLMRWLPEELTTAMEEEMALVPEAIFSMYLNSLTKKYYFNFRDTFGLEDFLKSTVQRILYVKTEDGKFDAAVLYNIFCQIHTKSVGHRKEHEKLDKYLSSGHHTFVDSEQMTHFEEFFHKLKLYKSNNLLVIDCSSLTENIEIMKKLLNRVFNHFINIPDKKCIIVTSQQNDLEEFLNSLKVSVKVVSFKQAKIINLTKESQEKLFAKNMLLIKGETLSLQDYGGADWHLSDLLQYFNGIISTQSFKNIVTDLNYTIQIENPLLNFTDLEVHYSKLNKEVSVSNIARSPQKFWNRVLLVINGIDQDQLRTEDRWKELADFDRGAEGRIIATLEDGEMLFKIKCRENPHKKIYLFEVSDELVYCKEIYDREFYITRHFHQNVIDVNKITKILQHSNLTDLFVFQNVTDKQSLLSLLQVSSEKIKQLLDNENIQTAISNEQVEEIIKKNYGKSVHILKLEENGSPFLVWQRSKGSLDGLSPYITADTERLMDEQHLCNRRHKVVIIADGPGTGKSTSLMSMSRLISKAWVIYIDLKKHESAAECLPTKLNLKATCEFLLNGSPSTDRTLLCGLLQICLKSTTSRHVYLLFDGFDEIEQSAGQKNVINLLEYLKDETTASIMLATRLRARETLEKKLSAFAIQFKNISNDQQRKFLLNFWHSHLALDVEQGENYESKLQKQVSELYLKAEQLLGTDFNKFAVSTLQMKMLSEMFLPEAETFVDSLEILQKISERESVLDLYQKFINVKYNTYLNEKTEICTTAISNVNKKMKIEELIEKHRVLGLQTMFPDFAKEHFVNITREPSDELCKLGMIQVNENGHLEFIYGRFAEYFCAELIFHWISQQCSYYQYIPMEKIFVSQILLQPNDKIIRLFLNNLLQSNPLSKSTLELISVKIDQLWDENHKLFFNTDHQTPLHVAVQERNWHIVDFLLNPSLEHPVRISLIAALDNAGRSALGMAARNAEYPISKVEKIPPEIVILEKFIQCVEMCSYEFKQSLLLATYIKDKKAFKILHKYLRGSNVGPETELAYNNILKILHKDVKPYVRDRDQTALGEDNAEESAIAMFERLSQLLKNIASESVPVKSEIGRELINLRCSQLTQDMKRDRYEDMEENKKEKMLQFYRGTEGLFNIGIQMSMKIPLIEKCLKKLNVPEISKNHFENNFLKTISELSHITKGWTMSAEFGHLCNSADIDRKTTGQQSLTLMPYRAAEGKHLPVVKYSKKIGMDTDNSDIEEKTTLHRKAEG